MGWNISPFQLISTKQLLIFQQFSTVFTWSQVEDFKQFKLISTYVFNIFNQISTYLLAQISWKKVEKQHYFNIFHTRYFNLFVFQHDLFIRSSKAIFQHLWILTYFNKFSSTNYFDVFQRVISTLFRPFWGLKYVEIRNLFQLYFNVILTPGFTDAPGWSECWADIREAGRSERSKQGACGWEPSASQGRQSLIQSKGVVRQYMYQVYTSIYAVHEVTSLRYTFNTPGPLYTHYSQVTVWTVIYQVPTP